MSGWDGNSVVLLNRLVERAAEFEYPFASSAAQRLLAA
jgi:hypothetical protein